MPQDASQSTRELIDIIKSRLAEAAEQRDASKWPSRTQYLLPRTDAESKANEKARSDYEEIRKARERNLQEFFKANPAASIMQDMYNNTGISLSVNDLIDPKLLENKLREAGQSGWGDSNHYLNQLNEDMRERLFELNLRGNPYKIDEAEIPLIMNKYKKEPKYRESVGNTAINIPFLYEHLRSQFPDMAPQDVLALTHEIRHLKQAHPLQGISIPEILGSLNTYRTDQVHPAAVENEKRKLLSTAKDEQDRKMKEADFHASFSRIANILNPRFQGYSDERLHLDPTRAKQEYDLYSPLAAKFAQDLTSADVADILSGQRQFQDPATKEHMMQAALRKGRQLDFEAKGYPTPFPEIASVGRLNPNEYMGERYAQFTPETRQSFEENRKLRDLAEEQNVLRGKRFDDFIAARENEPSHSDRSRTLLKPVYDFHHKLVESLGKVLPVSPEYTDSPFYKEVIHDAEHTYDLLRKREDKDFEEKILNPLRGRFAVQGGQHSSAYQDAIKKAKEAHAERMAMQHRLLLNEARKDAMSYHQWGNQEIRQRAHTLNEAANQGVARAQAINQVDSDAVRADRLRAIENEKLRLQHEQANLAHLAGRAASLEGEGAVKESKAREAIAAKRQAYEERPGGESDIRNLVAIMNSASGIPGAQLPSPPTVAPVMPPPAASASNATLLSGLGSQFGNIAFGPQTNPFNPNLQQQPQRQGFADGGVVTNSSQFLNDYTQNLEAYKKAKEAHAARDVPLRSPAWAGLGDVASGIGQALSNRTSALGGWSQGVSRAGERFDEYAKAQHEMSRQRADMEKELQALLAKGADIESDVARNEEAARHHRHIEEMQRAQQLESMRHNRLAEELKMRELMGGKPLSEKEIEKRLEKQDESETGLNKITHMMSKSILLDALAPYVASGPVRGKLGPALSGALSNKSTIAGLKYYDQLAGELALDRVGEIKGVRSNYLAQLIQSNKPNLDNPYETNQAAAQRFIKGSIPLAQKFIKEGLRAGKTPEEMMEMLHDMDAETRTSIDNEIFNFAKANNDIEDKSKIEKMRKEALSRWDQTYDAMLHGIKSLDVRRGHSSREGRRSLAERFASEEQEDDRRPLSFRSENISYDVDPAHPGPELEISSTQKGNEPPKIAVKEEGFPIKEYLSKGADILSELPVKGARLAQKVGEGAAETIDFLNPIAYVTDKAKIAPYIRSIGGEYHAEPGSIEDYLHSGAKFAGSVLGGGVAGASIKGLGGHFAKLGSGKIAEGASKLTKGFGEFLGASPMEKAVVGKPQDLVKAMSLAAPIGVASKGLERTFDLHPVASDLVAALGVAPVITALETKNPSILIDMFRRNRGSVSREMAGRIKDFVGEENVDDIIKRIKEYQSPLEGYEATTAERVYRPDEKNYPSLALIERSLGGEPQVTAMHERGRETLKGALKETYVDADRKKVHDLLQKEFRNDRESLDKLNKLFSPEGKTMDLEDLGSSLRQSITEKLLDLKQARKKATEPLYEKIKSSGKWLDDFDNTSRVMKDMELYGTSDDGKRILSKLSNSLFIDGEPRPLTLGKFESERQNIAKLYQKAWDGGEMNDARIFKNLLDAMADDMAAVDKTAAKARNLYKEMSGPINAITENPTISKALRYSRGEPQVSDTAIGRSFGEGYKSKEEVKKLRDAIGVDGLNVLEDYGRSSVLNDVIDADGFLSLNKIKAFEKKHGGVFEAHPELKRDLEKLEEAQKVLEGKAGREAKGRRDIYAETETPEHMTQRILSGDKRDEVVKEIFDRLKKIDVSDEGSRSLRANLLENMFNDITKNGKNHFTLEGYDRYMRKNGRLLNNHLTEGELGVLSSIRTALESQRFALEGGKVPGSPTAHLHDIQKRLYEDRSGLLGEVAAEGARKVLSGAVKSVIPGGRELMDVLGRSEALKGVTRKDRRRSLLSQFATNPEKAVEILESTKKTNLLDALRRNREEALRTITMQSGDYSER